MVLRHELKFEVDALEYQLLKKKLATALKPDPYIWPRGYYNVRTLYFDDFCDSALQEKEAGLFIRKKFRLRIYNHSDAFVKFECKRKIGSYVYKETARISREEAERLILGDCGFLANSKVGFLKEFYLESRCKLLRPVVIVEYEREAFVHPIGNVRVTFDLSLRMGYNVTSFFEDKIPLVGVLDPLGIILEVKYNQVIPKYIRGLFPDTIKPRLAIGKFVICRTQQINQRCIK